MSNHESRITGHGFFITGTDTGVGKTLVACALLHALAARGLRAIGMKPVAAGVREEKAGLVNEDVSALAAASNIRAPQELINPYCFALPVAPHIAADEARVCIDPVRVHSAYAALAARADCVIVEGAGGFYVPLGPRYDTRDLAVSLSLPVLLVVGMRLGCLNHALLTAAAVAAAGLRLAGWFANHIDPDMAYATQNVRALEERLSAPLIARIPYASHVDARRVARKIDVDSVRSL